MKLLKKYISAAAAAALIGIYAIIPVYAENDDLEFPEDEEVVEVEDAEEENPDEIIPIEDEDDPDVDVEDNVDDPDVDIVGIDTPEEDEPDLTDDTPAITQAAPSADTTPQYNAVSPYTMYSNEVVNVRYGPDTSYSKLGTVYANSPVTVVGTAGGWLVIEYNGTKGFVSSSFFSQTAPTTTTTTAAATQAAPVVTEQTEATEATTEPQQAEIVDETTTKKTKAPETEPPAVETPDETAETTTANNTADEDKDKEAAAASTDSDKKNGGLGGILLALGCAVGTFVLVGVLPVVIHSIYHKKLYQY